MPWVRSFGLLERQRQWEEMGSCGLWSFTVSQKVEQKALGSRIVVRRGPVYMPLEIQLCKKNSATALSGGQYGCDRRVWLSRPQESLGFGHGQPFQRGQSDCPRETVPADQPGGIDAKQPGRRRRLVNEDARKPTG